MATKINLTRGALQLMMRRQVVKDPIMQILASKPITSESGTVRIRLLLSDGQNTTSYAVLTSKNDKLLNNTIVKIKNYNVILNELRCALVILELEILWSGEQVEKIGDPMPLLYKENEVVISNNVSENEESLKAATVPLRSKSSDEEENTTSNKVVENEFRDNMNDSIASVQSDSTQDMPLEDRPIHLISNLNPYQNKLLIKVRVTGKSSIRSWKNFRGEGKFFTMDLRDESGEIRCTVFQDLVEKFYDMMEVDKIYYIRKYQIKFADKRFNNLKNDYEMSFTNHTIVEEGLDDYSVPRMEYNYIDIAKIPNKEIGSEIDIIGVCKEASDLQCFQSRSTGKELKKREIVLVDRSYTAISLTLWGADAETFNGSSNPVVSVKRAKVGEFGGTKNVSVLSNSILTVNPKGNEGLTAFLESWYKHYCVQNDILYISARSGTIGSDIPWSTLSEAQEMSLQNHEKSDYCKIKVTVLLFRSNNCFYKACPVEDCKKKVYELGNGLYQCEKCNSNYNNFKYRLIVSVNVADKSADHWIHMFSSEAEKILGMTAEEVGRIVEANPSALTDIVEKASFKQFIIKCYTKMDTFREESRLRTVAVKVDDVNYKEYNSHLITKIKNLLGN